MMRVADAAIGRHKYILSRLEIRTGAVHIITSSGQVMNVKRIHKPSNAPSNVLVT